MFTSVDNVREDLQGNMKLEQNYPNPFNSSTQITCHITRSGKASLKIIGMMGNEVAVLFDEMKVPGTYTVTFRRESIPGGVYFYRLEQDANSVTKKLILIN